MQMKSIRACGMTGNNEVIDMSRKKKDAKLLNIKLNREIHEQIERFCEESGMTKTTATERFSHSSSRSISSVQRRNDEFLSDIMCQTNERLTDISRSLSNRRNLCIN